MADVLGLVAGQLFMLALVGIYIYKVIEREFGGMGGFREALDEVI